MNIKIEKRGGPRHKPKKSHQWKQSINSFKSRTEAYDHWRGEGKTIKLKKSMKKDNRGQNLKECK